MNWQLGRFNIKLDRPYIMGIVNLTPDSFSDGGDYSQSLRESLHHAERHLNNGADIIDVGGESSRPGATYVAPRDEIRRLEGFLKEVKKWNVPVTIDTRRAEVMRHFLELDYVDGINDIEALQDEGSLNLLAQYDNVGICLMHKKGEPISMQEDPEYTDVVTEVIEFLNQRVEACEKEGISRERIVVDPGIGFGKTTLHNIELLRNTKRLVEETNLPTLIGVSRKSFIGEICNIKDPKKRMIGSVAVMLHQIRLGARIVRVHDVKESAQAIRMAQELEPSLFFFND